MKLNNKGFAITSIMYSILILFLALILGILALLGNRKMTIDKTKKELLEKFNGPLIFELDSDIKIEYENQTVGDYIVEQKIKVSFENTNDESVFYVKSTRPDGILNIGVSESCGVSTNPDICETLEDQITILDANTWYKVNDDFEIDYDKGSFNDDENFINDDDTLVVAIYYKGFVDVIETATISEIYYKASDIEYINEDYENIKTIENALEELYKRY